MTTSLLISFIKKQIQNNVSKDLIISKLLGAGWHQEDIDEGFSKIEPEPAQTIPVSEIKNENPVSPVENTEMNKEISDKYREPLSESEVFGPKEEIQKIEQPKTEQPEIEEPKVEIPKVEPTIIVEAPKSEPIKVEPAVIVEVPKLEPVKVETPKVWTPMSIPVKENTPINNDEKELVAQNKEIEIPKENIKPVIKQPINPVKTEDMIPKLVPKVAVNNFGYTQKDNPINNNVVARGDMMNNLPKMAMLSSYQNDLMSIKKTNLGIIKKKNHKIIKLSAIATLICSIILFVMWLFAGGYINTKILSFSLIKKDPKILLLNNSKVLSSLKSYKTETKLEISSPSFSNISYGLLSGETVSSDDKDSISIDALGTINQDDKGMISDNYIMIKSSILPDTITTDIKNNGSDLFVSVPDLNKIIKGDAPSPAVVKINESEFSSVPAMFSPKIRAQLQRINIYKILSGGLTSYVNNETLNSYNELVNNVGVSEKGEENIKGVDTYHYGINADRQLSKNLLIKISDNFTSNLSPDDKNQLDQILGSITIDSFDIWIGKDNNSIYQYSVVVDIPLSKLIGFEDKSIGDNKVNISWQTTYYDFDTTNIILMPESYISMSDFSKSVELIKIKNDISSFSQLATTLSNVEKSYGKSSNQNGSCMNPTTGSLFSPTGHSKNAVTAVSSISAFLNKILAVSGNVGSCYSTTKAWSFAVPVPVDINTSLTTETTNNSFFCVDSTGSTKTLTSLPTSVVCK